MYEFEFRTGKVSIDYEKCDGSVTPKVNRLLPSFFHHCCGAGHRRVGAVEEE